MNDITNIIYGRGHANIHFASQYSNEMLRLELYDLDTGIVERAIESFYDINDCLISRSVVEVTDRGWQYCIDHGNIYNFYFINLRGGSFILYFRGCSNGFIDRQIVMINAIDVEIYSTISSGSYISEFLDDAVGRLVERYPEYW